MDFLGGLWAEEAVAKLNVPCMKDVLLGQKWNLQEHKGGGKRWEVHVRNTFFSPALPIGLGEMVLHPGTLARLSPNT